MSFTIRGQQDLTKRLNQLSHGIQRRVLLSGVSAGLTVARKQVVNAIPGTMKDLRRAVGVRRPKFQSRRSAADAGVRTGKVGFGVGKSRAQSAALGAKAAAGRDPNRPGVGISIANFGWWLFGTADRWHDSSKHTGQARPGFRSKQNIIHSPQSRDAASKKKNAKFRGMVQLHYTGKMPASPVSPVKQGIRSGKSQINAAVEAKVRQRVAVEAQKLRLKG